MLFLLLGIAFQTAARVPIDPATYLEFFRDAVRQVDAPMQGYVNGTSTMVGKPAVSDILGISHEQAARVLQIALFCTGDVTRLDEMSRPLVFQSRLELTDDGQITQHTATRLRDMETRRTALILSYAQQMKNALGDETFHRVEDYIRKHAGQGYFPSAIQQSSRVQSH